MDGTSFKTRQENLLELISEGAVLVSGGNYKQKSHDTDYPFRIHSDFKYLLGFEEPETLLVMTKNSSGVVRRHLFLRSKDPLMEMWMGKRLGVEKAKDILTVDETYPVSKIEETLPSILHGHKNLYFDLFNSELCELVTKTTKKLCNKRKEKAFKPLSWHSVRDLVGTLRLYKDQNEISAIKKAAQLTEVGHRLAMAKTKPGINEKEISDLLGYIFSQGEGEGPAYDSIVAGGENALILHYIENNQDLQKGDLILIDAGAQLNTYASDVTRTFPVDGKFTEAQKEIYSIVLESQKTAFSVMKNGSNLTDIHNATSQSLLRSLINHKIVKGEFEENLEKGTIKKYYPHGTGHWLGLDVHDMCPYYDSHLEDIKLAPGMIFTCEPGLYFPPTDSEIPPQYRGIGIRIEDDILMTKEGYENLTRSIPKEIKEVEEACQADPKSILSKLSSLPLLV